MKNMLALVGLVVVLTAGLGWYLGWYKLATSPGQDGHRNINVDLDTNKIKTDIKTGAQKAGEVIQSNSTGTPTPQNGPTVQVGSDGSATMTLPKLEIKTGQ